MWAEWNAIAPHPGPPPSGACREVPRVLAGPPGWTFHLLAGVATLALLRAQSVPYGNAATGMPAALVLLVLAGVWGFRALVHLIARSTGWTTTGRARWWLMAPTCGLLVAGLSLADVPLRARWAASRSELEQVVVDTEGTDGAIPIDGRLGHFDISSARRAGDSVVFYESTGGFISLVGFAYLPDGPQPLRDLHHGEVVSIDHLDEEWYTFSASW